MQCTYVCMQSKMYCKTKLIVAILHSEDNERQLHELEDSGRWGGRQWKTEDQWKFKLV